MNEFSTYEYVVAKKREGAYKWGQIGLISLYIIYGIIVLSIGIIARLLAPFIALIPVTTWILIYFTWRYVSIEYEYSITSGVLTFSKIYGKRTHKKIVEIRLKKASAIAPLNDRLHKSKLEAYGAEKTYNALSSQSTEDAYFITYEDENENKCVLFFEATAQALKICRFYNPSSTVITKVRF